MKKLSLAEILNCFRVVESIDDSGDRISVLIRSKRDVFGEAVNSETNAQLHAIETLAFVAGYRYPVVTVGAEKNTETWTWNVPKA